MIISLSNFHYSNKSIPNFIDYTILKVVRISRFIFLRPFVFLLDGISLLLTHRNIVWKKDKIDISSLKENFIRKPQEIQDVPILEKTFTEMHAQKYLLSLGAQKETLKKICLDEFETTPQILLDNLKLFCQKKVIDPKFDRFLRGSSLNIHNYLIKIMEVLVKDHLDKELRYEYRKYNDAIRSVLKTEEYLKNKTSLLARIIQDLCFAKFVKTILTDFEEEFVLKRVIKFDSSQSITPSNISKLIVEGNEALKNSPRDARKSLVLLNSQKLRNEFGVCSDPLVESNISELRSIHEIQDGSICHLIYYMRHPTPTIDRNCIAPEYEGFLDAAEEMNFPILYVNHQHKSGLLCSLPAENERAKAVQKLEERKIFHFLSLPFDGPIIEKIKEKNLELWKEDLIDAVVGEKQGFKIPKKSRESIHEKKEVLNGLLNDLQKLYFFGKQELKETERRVLLVIFYSYLKEYFKAEYHIRIMASVCKDNKDRGNVSACIDEALFNLRLGKESDQQALYDLYLRALAPFIIKYEEIVSTRLQFLIDLLDHIAMLNDVQKENIRDFRVNKQYQIVKQWVPRLHNESANALS